MNRCPRCGSALELVEGPWHYSSPSWGPPAWAQCTSCDHEEDVPE